MMNVKCSCTRLMAIAGGLAMAASAALAATAPATFSNKAISGPNAASATNVLTPTNKSATVNSSLTTENQIPGRPDPERVVQECVACADNEGEGLVDPCLTAFNHGCFDSPQLGGTAPAAGWGFGSALLDGVEKCGYLSRDTQPVSGQFERDVDYYTFTVPAGGRRVVIDWQSDVDVFVSIGTLGPSGSQCTTDSVLAATAAAVNPCSTSALNAPPDANPVSQLVLDAAAGTNYFVYIGKLGGGGIENAPSCEDGNQYRLRLTLASLPTGACCNLDTGACVDNLDAVACSAPVGVQSFRGAGTVCASVNCGVVTCTPNGTTIVAEGEATCPPATDVTNAGCSVAAGNGPFGIIECNTTVCGKTAAFDGTRDTDWYEVDVGGVAQNLTMTVNAETNMECWIIGVPLSQSCDDPLSGFAAAGGPGAPIVVTEAGATGLRWIYVSTATAINVGVFSGVECFHDYSLQFSCENPQPAACCTNNSSATPVCVDNRTESECVAQNGIYRGSIDGVPTTCATIECCANPCAADAGAEGGTSKSPLAEPLCGDGGNDFINGGCAQEPGLESFRDVSCVDNPNTVAREDVICGTAAFDRTLGLRDTDWFEIQVTDPTYLAAIVAAQFQSAVFIFQPGPIDPNDPRGCAALTQLSGFGAENCDLNIAGACLAAGTYYIAVVADFDEAFPCTANGTYELSILCCDDCVTDFSCSPGAGSEPAGESDCNGDNGGSPRGNDGCAVDVPTAADFQTILAGQKICGTSALTTDSGTGIITRDPDQFRFNSPGGAVVYKLRAEFVADLLIFTPAGLNQGCDNAVLEDGFILGCATAGATTNDVDPTPDLPAGDQIVVVAPSFFQDDFACGLQYELEITGGAPPCNCVRGQGDANGDCDVNGADLSVLLSQFGTNVAPNTGADFNNSGSVNGADLSVLLSNFGCNTP